MTFEDDLKRMAAEYGAVIPDDPEPEDWCERAGCGAPIWKGDERHLCYGAVWCASCHDNHYDQGEEDES